MAKKWQGLAIIEPMSISIPTAAEAAPGAQDAGARDSTRKITASDVAERAGVSRWTVSRAFTDGASVAPAVRERILEVATELGYRPNLLARGLIKRRTHLIGVVVDELANPNLTLLLDEVTRQLQRQGHLSILLNISESDSSASMLSLADQFQVDGLIFLGTVLTEDLVRLAQDVRHIPLVVLYRSSDHPDLQVVTTDNERAGREIAALVAAEGVQRIAYMAGPPADSTQLRRLEGFREGLAQHGLWADTVLHAGHYRRECGEAAMAAVLDACPPAEWPELLFCENDILAIGAADLLRQRGLTGRIGLIGFDDIEQAGSPSYDLTTYHQPMHALVSEAVRRVVGGESGTPRVLLPGTLVRRSSHRRPAA